MQEKIRIIKPKLIPAFMEGIRETLEALHDKYNNTGFIESDPISIPHRFSTREDIEISGFLASVIAWGNRKAIVKSAGRMISMMDGAPYDFVTNATEPDIARLSSFVHRTFNGQDFICFIRSLQNIYSKHGGIGAFFEREYSKNNDLRPAISAFKKIFFETGHHPHAQKHISSIDSGSACKRINMYLRWMVRKDGQGVDFGLWKNIPASALYLPLDVHAGNMSRAFGLLRRKQNDWKAVEEVTSSLRTFDAADPVKYDFALFGAGIDGFLK